MSNSESESPYDAEARLCTLLVRLQDLTQDIHRPFHYGEHGERQDAARAERKQVREEILSMFRAAERKQVREEILSMFRAAERDAWEEGFVTAERGNTFAPNPHEED